ncbi:hypothetical protein SAMN04487901_103196 [Prevotella communis]|uniref:Uncharacterized protein n=1 Tax=Prevotella communis TaxID=2913614 RepID=A0A1G7TZC2_9BACT|nr:hypothetical protein [Prevotella communis]SDG40508.1 hypothetical protein SAMN04487901_103196 [Prevotella communis]
MKKNFFVRSLCSAIAVMSVTAVIVSCSNDDDFEYEYYEEQVYTLAPVTRSVMYPEGGYNDRPFLKYSNCGLWGLAMMCGDADNGKYQGAVLSAAKSAIDWDEDKNMENLQNNNNVRGLSGDEILSVCNEMKEVNNNASGFEKISNLDNNLPDSFEGNPTSAQQIVENLKNSSDGKKVKGVMVGVEVWDAEKKKYVDHWISLDRFTKNGDMQVRDQLTSQQYLNSERCGNSQYSDRYKTTYSVSRVKCVLYKK